MSKNVYPVRNKRVPTGKKISHGVYFFGGGKAVHNESIKTLANMDGNN